MGGEILLKSKGAAVSVDAVVSAHLYFNYKLTETKTESLCRPKLVAIKRSLIMKLPLVTNDERYCFVLCHSGLSPRASLTVL